MRVGTTGGDIMNRSNLSAKLDERALETILNVQLELKDAVFGAGVSMLLS